MIEYNKNFDDNSILSFFIKPQNDPARGQVQFYYNLIVNSFEKGNSPCTQEFPESRIKRQIVDHYFKNICNISSYYVIFRVEIASPNSNHIRHQIQTNDIDIELSKVSQTHKKHTTAKLTKNKFNIQKRCIFNHP